jgi:hypothetical protein
VVCEVFVESGPGDVAGDPSEELVQEGIAVLAIIGERNESMPKIEFRTIDCLTALKIGRTDARGPVDGLLPKTKIEEPVTVKAIIQADELIDDPGADAKAEHEGHEFAGLRVPQQNEVGDVFSGDKLKEPRCEEFEFRFSLLIGLPKEGKDLIEKQGVRALEHRHVKISCFLAASELAAKIVAIVGSEGLQIGDKPTSREGKTSAGVTHEFEQPSASAQQLQGCGCCVGKIFPDDHRSANLASAERESIVDNRHYLS